MQKFDFRGFAASQEPHSLHAALLTLERMQSCMHSGVRTAARRDLVLFCGAVLWGFLCFEMHTLLSNNFCLSLIF